MSQRYLDYILSETPEAVWPYGDTGTTTAGDFAGNGHQGTFSGTLTQGTAAIPGDPFGGSFTLAGGHGATASSSSFSVGTGNFAIEFWIKTSTSASMVVVGSTAGQFWAGVFGNKAVLSCNGPFVQGATTINDGNLHHVLVQRVSGNLQVYVDGVSDATPVAGTNSMPATFQVGLGSFEGGGSAYTGLMAWAAFYKHSITSPLAHYNAGHSAPTTYTVDAPIQGQVNVASQNFSIQPASSFTGTITPATSGSGTFTPSSLTWAASTTAQTFKYTPTSTSGSPHSISFTNSAGWTDPASANYIVGSSAVAVPDQILAATARFASTSGLYKDLGTTPVSADADLIEQWNDLTANGNNLTQTTSGNRFKYDALLNIVQQEYGQNQFMSLPAGATINTQKSTVVFIGDLVTLRQGADSVANRASHAFFEGASDKLNLLYTPNTAPVLNAFDGVTRNSLSSTMLSSSPALMAFANGYGGTTIYSANGNSKTAAVMTLTAAVAGGTIGSYAASILPVNMRFRDIIFYPATLSQNQINSLITYAQTRGIATSFKYNVAIDGDSISAGVGSTMNRNWANQMTLTGSPRICNFGQSGFTLASAVTQRATDVDPFIVGGQTNVLVVFLGTNDLSAGATAAAVYANLQTYCTAAKLAGWNKIVAVTCLPRGSITDSIRQTYNASIRSGFANQTLACDDIYDAGNDPDIGQPGQYSGPNYNGDNTHLNTQGYGIFKSGIQPKIQQFAPVPAPSGSAYIYRDVILDSSMGMGF